LTFDFPLKKRFLTPVIDALEKRTRHIVPKVEQREAIRGLLLVVAAFGLLAIYLGYMGDTLTSRGWRTTILLAAKSFGSKALAIDIRASAAALSGHLMSGMWISIGIAVMALLSLLWVHKSKKYSTAAVLLSRRSEKWGIGFVSLGIAFSLSLPATFWILKNGKAFYDYANSHSELVENAHDLAVIRKDTKSGDLVLAWKICMAFYADKRSITDATLKDLDFYRENRIPSVMGPKKPLNRYYKRIEKYPPPMSYWVPKAQKMTKAGTSSKKD
jgi:hypothetical protein